MRHIRANGRRRVLIALLATMAVIAASCGDNDDDSDAASGDSGATTTSTSEGGEETGAAGELDTTPLVIARNMDLTSNDPHRAVCDTCQFVFNSLYETLVGLDTDNHTLIPGLAETWEVNDDSTEYTFHLASDAVFSDGSPVEAKDVAFSLMRLKNLKVSLTYLVDGITVIDTPDAKTAVVTLGAPNSEFLNNMNAVYTGIVNSDVAIEQGASAEDDADVTDTAEPWFITNSAGSGPYVLSEFSEGDHLTVTANENYWKEPAAIETIVIKQAENAAAQAQMLEIGEADIAMQIDPFTAEGLEGADDVTVETITSFNFFWLGLAEGTTTGTSAPLTADVRKAITLAIDYQGLIDTLVDGNGSLMASPIPNGFPGAEGLPPREQDLDEAQRLMDEAGLSDGLTVTLGYPTINAYGVDFGQLAQIVQQDLAQINVNVELDPQAFAVMIDKYRGYELPMNLLYWAPDYFGSSQYVSYFGLVDGSTWSKHAGGSDETPAVNEAEQAAYTQALASTDEAERADLYNQAGQEMINDNAVIPLFSPDLVLAYRSDVEGVFYSACCNIYLAQLSRT